MSDLTVSTILRKLRRDGRLIPFVGAGLSKPLGLPDWSTLIDFIAKQLDYEPASLTVIEHVRLTYACPCCEKRPNRPHPRCRR